MAWIRCWQWKWKQVGFSEYILKVEPTEFPNGLEMRCERGIKDNLKVFGLSRWKDCCELRWGKSQVEQI